MNAPRTFTLAYSNKSFLRDRMLIISISSTPGRVALETFMPRIGAVNIQTIGGGEALGWSSSFIRRKK
jgi:hypothetical protein